MRALVTGGAGFIGSSIARKLLERGDEVVILDNLMGGFRESVPDGAEFIEGDLRDPADLERAVAAAEVVFHEAAIRSVPRSLDEPSLVHDSNVTGTLNLLIAAEEAGARRLVYASSSSLYGGAFEGPSREDMTPNPLSPYAVSKLAGEHYCRVWSSLGRLPTVCLRYFNVFGPGQSPESKYAAVFPAFISALKHDEAPDIHGDGEQSRDFTFIDDVVRANLLAAEAAGAEGAVMNVAGGRPRTVNEVFRSISGALGKDLEPRHVAPREGDIRHSHADAARVRELLGWHVESDWATAVKQTVEWFA
ncbi:MAG: NAD-dependent epimerase/dehydratase family protein [Actinomycetota bacterium]